MKLDDLSNEALLAGLHALVGQGRALLARMLVYLGEVEERRLDLESACSRWKGPERWARHAFWWSRGRGRERNRSSHFP
jgi:hypothetical protein